MIYIFGDSYGDPVKHYVFVNRKVRHDFISKGPFWYDYLKEYDEVKNWSKSGTGPYFSFDKFYNRFENGEIKKEDKIVFILSSPHRIGDNNLGDMLLSKDTTGENSKWLDGDNKSTNREIQKEEIKTVYKYLQREIDFLNFKNVSFLKFFSQLNNSKVIVFRAFDNKSFDIDTKDYPEHLYDLSVLNDTNFYYYPRTLFDVTINEVVKNDLKNLFNWNELNTTNSEVDVGRTNHLTEYNHKILSNIIINFFYDTNFDETFKENFYIKQNVVDKEFIYE